MTTYKSYNDLKGHTLEEGDIIYFGTTVYNVYTSFLYSDFTHNDEIFRILNLNKNEFCDKIYGYPNQFSEDHSFPETKEKDYEALTKVTLALFEEYEKQYKVSEEGTFKNPYKSIINETIEDLRVGDIVTIRDNIKPGSHFELDGSKLPLMFSSEMIKYCGLSYIVTKINKDNTFYIDGVPKYVFCISMLSKIKHQKIDESLEFKVGDLVILKPNLVNNFKYGNLIFYDEMYRSFGSNPKSIININSFNSIQVKDSSFFYSTEMLQKVNDYKIEIHSTEREDFTRIKNGEEIEKEIKKENFKIKGESTIKLHINNIKPYHIKLKLS